MKKHYLLTPGPTSIPESVLAATAQPMIHHRTPAFEEIFKKVRTDLKYLFQTEQDVLILASTGTGAMEAAVSNLFNKGDSVIVINGGKFGERWTKIARSYGLIPLEIKLEPGDAISPAEFESFARANPSAKAVLFQGVETSTGALTPVQAICEIAKKHDLLTICDGITACGVLDLPMDRWGIDVLITGSQKALMTPPGLAMIALSEKAWSFVERSDSPRFYFDLLRERKNLSQNQTAWTPAISLIRGLGESLRLIREEGLQNVFKRHDLLARATRNAVSALGMEVLAKKSPSPSVTGVKVPTVIKDGKQIPKLMRDRYGVTISGGQDALEGKIFRLSHFGYCDRFDITTGISALELCLNEVGYPVEFGKGVGAALKVFSEG